jgi:hypothetical protein
LYDVSALRPLDDLFSGIPVIRASINVSYTHGNEEARDNYNHARFPMSLVSRKTLDIPLFPVL